MQDNPFAAPQSGEPPRRPDPDTPRPVVTWKILLRWTLVCFVSAAPSFVLGLLIEATTPVAIAGMLAGIVTFVLGYTALEHTAWIQRGLSRADLRLTARIGYGTRMGVSLLFPIGFYLDMFVGFVSVPVSRGLLMLTGLTNELDGPGIGLGGFFPHYLTTVVQGVCVNLVLFSYMLVVWAIVRAAMGPPVTPAYGSAPNP